MKTSKMKNVENKNDETEKGRKIKNVEKNY